MESGDDAERAAFDAETGVPTPDPVESAEPLSGPSGEAAEAPADGFSCVGQAPPPTLSLSHGIEVPADAAVAATSNGLSVVVRNEDADEFPVEVTAIVDFGGMESKIVPLDVRILEPGETMQATFDFGAHADAVAKMRFSGMLRFVARRIDTGEWVGTEPLFFHPPAPGKAPLLYREAVLIGEFRAGDFRGELSAALVDEPGVVTTRILDASAAPVREDDGLEPDLAPEVSP